MHVNQTLNNTAKLTHIHGNASKPRISKMYNVQETLKKLTKKQTDNRVFYTSIFAILVDFAFEFWYLAIDIQHL